MATIDATTPTADLSDGPPVVWRNKLRSLVDGVDPAVATERCIRESICAVGWDLGELPDSTTIDDVLTMIRAKADPGWGARAASCVRRFGQDAQVGDLIWTRDTRGRFRLGMIAGDYYYDGSPEARATDLHQVRPTTWLPRVFDDLDVPGAVVRAFTGPGSTLSRIHNESARQLSQHLWNNETGNPSSLSLSHDEILRDVLDPYDVEDLVFIWLQVERNMLVLPRSRARDTPLYEWTMIDRQDHRRAIVQVKTGNVALDIASLESARTSTDVKTFAFATSDQYVNCAPDSPTERIDPLELVRFVASHPNFLSDRIRSRFAIART